MSFNLALNLRLGLSKRASGLLLDKLDSAAAYSLRKLRSSYTGDAIRVRRSSDNAEADIGFSGTDLDTTALMNHVGYQNLLTYSEQFDNADWSKNSVSVTPDSVSDPLGGTTADVISGVAVPSSTLIIFQNITQTVNIGETYTASVWVRNANIPDLRFRIARSGAGAFESESLSIPQSSEWQRISASRTFTNAQTGLRLDITSPFGSSNPSIEIWGAQINAGDSAQPYQQTVATANDGNGFVTTWYDQSDNARHVTQTTAGSQPNIMKNGVLNEDENGNVFLDFDTKFMEASVGIGSASSIVAVYSKSVTAVNLHVFGSGKDLGLNGVNIFEDSSGRTNVTKDINRYYDAVDNSLNKKILVGENTSTVAYYKNGVQNILSNAVATAVESAKISIGTSSFPAQVKFYAGMIFQNQLSTTDRQALERNQGAYYGITVA